MEGRATGAPVVGPQPHGRAFEIAARVLERWRDPGQGAPTNLYAPLSAIARRWLNEHLECVGGTTPAQLMYRAIADLAADRIVQAIVRTPGGDKRVRAIPDAFEPRGSSAAVNFTTSRTDRWETSAQHCHVGWAVLDSGWEGEFCRAVEGHPGVLAYVKNHGLGFEVPYLYQGQRSQDRPDFIVKIDDGRGADDPLHLLVEIKGYRGEDAKDKKATMLTQWVPGVNALGTYGRWDFVEFADVWTIDADLKAKVQNSVGRVLDVSRPASRQGAPT